MADKAETPSDVYTHHKESASMTTNNPGRPPSETFGRSHVAVTNAIAASAEVGVRLSALDAAILTEAMYDYMEKHAARAAAANNWARDYLAAHADGKGIDPNDMPADLGGGYWAACASLADNLTDLAAKVIGHALETLDSEAKPTPPGEIPHDGAHQPN